MSSSAKRVLCIGLVSVWALSSNADEGISPQSDLAKVGRMVYQQHCATCHGRAAEGAPNWKKQDARGELPPPPHGPEGHTWRHADRMLRRMINQGWRDPFNKTQRLTMPAFETILTPKEVDSVITYLKTFWTPKQKQFQQQENRARSENSAQSSVQEQ